MGNNVAIANEYVEKHVPSDLSYWLLREKPTESGNEVVLVVKGYAPYLLNGNLHGVRVVRVLWSVTGDRQWLRKMPLEVPPDRMKSVDFYRLFADKLLHRLYF